MTILSEIVLSPPLRTAPAGILTRITPWLTLACAGILFAAALLHWRRSGHWWLLALATGSLFTTLGAAAAIIGRFFPMVLFLPDGGVRIVTTAHSIAGWSAASGLAIAAVGGVGAIRAAILLRRGAG